MGFSKCETCKLTVWKHCRDFFAKQPYIFPISGSSQRAKDVNFGENNTEGLIRDVDGGLTITVQRAEPNDPVKRANWLPAPEGEFYMSMRLYWPKPAALDGTWEPSLVERMDWQEIIMSQTFEVSETSKV